jgi:quercetin dioxygenase-like cupin family protein
MKTFISHLTGIVLLITVTSSMLSAQDWTKLNTNGRETLVDTTLLEAVILTFEPGEKLGPMTHPVYFAYALTGGKIKVHVPEGEPMILEFDAGFNLFAGPEGPHMTENIGGKTVKFLLVELKEHPYIAPKE